MNRVEKNKLFNELQSVLINKDVTTGRPISDKRNGKIEKIQIDILRELVGDINMKYNNLGISIDPSFLDNIKKKKNQWIITDDGKIIRRESKDRNDWYDSKSFDMIVPINIRGKKILTFFIYKGIENAGGSQDNARREVGRYTKQIQKNTNDNYYFIFVLDGTYAKKDIEKLESSSKYIITDSENLKDAILSLIIKIISNG